MRHYAVSTVTAILMLAGSLAAQAQSQPAGSWPSNEAFNTGNGFNVGGSASDGSYLYCMGGYFDGTTSFRRYDPANDSWQYLAGMPQDNVYFQGAYVAGHVYILGNGYYGNGDIYRYDISADMWSSSLGTLENNRYQSGAAVLNDKIYIAGGYDNFNGGYSAALEVFDPSDLSLTTLADMPQGLSLPFSAGMPFNGRVYFVGGQGNNGDSSATLEYDPTTDIWFTRASISNGSAATTRYFPGGFVFGAHLYLVGGYNNGYQATTLEYSPPSDAWIQRANMNSGRYGFAYGVINGNGYVYGGESNGNWYQRERFIPPDFGSAPDLPSSVVQVGAQSSSSDQGGWTNAQIQFQATVTDPDAGQQVRLEVQVRPSGSANWGPVLSSGNGAQGLRSISYAIPSNGSYDWRWRVADTFNNYAPTVGGQPSWVEAFSNAVSPDFQSDQISPADPIAQVPSGVDVAVGDPVGGNVTLAWTESTDNGPASAITYEIQVARDAGFLNLEGQFTSTAGTSSMDVYVTVSRTNKYWRLRAHDVGGNTSAWSNVLSFRVVFDDHMDHGAGDAKKSCGFGVAGGLPGLGCALLGLTLLGMVAFRRRAIR